jgi:hypothetical protein
MPRRNGGRLAGKIGQTERSDRTLFKRVREGRGSRRLPGDGAAALDMAAEGVSQFVEHLAMGGGEVRGFARIVRQVVELEGTVRIVLQQLPIRRGSGLGNSFRRNAGRLRASRNRARAVASGVSPRSTGTRLTASRSVGQCGAGKFEEGGEDIKDQAGIVAL